jgi:phospholipase C
VILVEPSYYESPVDLEDAPNDNHPPLPMAPGEAYVKRIYDALTANPDRWASTLFVLTYDEHGGFYDHAVPPPLVAPVPPGASYTVPFTTAGVRTPAVVISPLVKAGSVYSGLLDNTSILQLLAERFDPQSSGYSAEVNNRRAQGVQSLSAALAPDGARADQPIAVQPPAATALAPAVPPTRPPQQRQPMTPLRSSFTQAADRLQTYPAWTAEYNGFKY